MEVLFLMPRVQLLVFLRILPFFGFQTILGLFFARVAKGNLFIAAIGTWISNPFTYLYIFSIIELAHITKKLSDIILDKNILIEDYGNKEVSFL